MIPPVPRLEGLERWEGMWVAIRDSQVIAAAPSSRELVYRLQEMGPSAFGATTEYVRPGRDDAYAVGAG